MNAISKTSNTLIASPTSRQFHRQRFDGRCNFGKFTPREKPVYTRLSLKWILVFLRTGFTNAFPLGRHVPQGRKPAFCQTLNGTAEQLAEKAPSASQSHLSG